LFEIGPRRKESHLHPREFGPNLTASDFGGSLEWEVGHGVVRVVLGKMPSERRAWKRGGPIRQTLTARQCAPTARRVKVEQDGRAKTGAVDIVIARCIR
jgi:hypothetical protein